MPTYEYGCSACGREWEEVQRITAPPTEVCPTCGKAAAHRLISAGTNFILKGGGWYSDLYSSSKGEAKKPESNGATTSDSSTQGEKTENGGTKAGDKAETKAAGAEGKGTASSPSPPPTAASSSS
jgi:putative FmdB family regulatory protein